MDIEKAAPWHNIGTFWITLIVLVITAWPALFTKSTQPATKPSTQSSKTPIVAPVGEASSINWPMVAVLGFVVISSGVLNLVAARLRRRVQPEKPVPTDNRASVNDIAKYQARVAELEKALTDARTASKECSEAKAKLQSCESELTDLKKAVKSGSFAKAALMQDYALQADDLNSFLESVWHSWDAHGEKLVHPLVENYSDQIKNIGAAATTSLMLALSQFRYAYSNHVNYVKSRLPDLVTHVIEGGFPSDKDYLTVRRDLSNHAGFLRARAEKLLASAGYATGA